MCEKQVQPIVSFCNVITARSVDLFYGRDSFPGFLEKFKRVCYNILLTNGKAAKKGIYSANSLQIAQRIWFSIIKQRKEELPIKGYQDYDWIFYGHEIDVFAWDLLL